MTARRSEDYAHTLDVTTGAGSFAELLLPPWVVNALRANGYNKPSPVQTIAIPMGRLGADLIVQAKAGTGKTLVFGIVCLDKVDPEVGMPQALVLAPTREIALQSGELLSRLAAHMAPPGITIGTFIGGLPIAEDQKLLRRRCQVALGTPGRVSKLMEIGSLVLQRCGTVVLDEADHLMSDSFVGIVRQIVMEVILHKKQIIALSATYSTAALATLESLMTHPQRVMLCHSTVALLGIRQFYHEISCQEDDGNDVIAAAKIHALLRLLSSTTFNQAVVFTNATQTAQQAASSLARWGYPAQCLSAARPQVERMDSVGAVRSFKFRIVVATDLAARGLDLPAVNLVVNLDLPYDGATYAHRVGRGGRYGTHGVAVTFASTTELKRLQVMVREVEGGQLEVLPEVIPEELLYCGNSSWEDNSPSTTNSAAAVCAPEARVSDHEPLAADHSQSVPPVTVWQRGYDAEQLSESHEEYSSSDYSCESDAQFSDDDSNSGVASHIASPELLASSVHVSHSSAVKEEHYEGSGPRGLAATMGGVMGASLWHSDLHLEPEQPVASDCIALSDITNCGQNQGHNGERLSEGTLMYGTTTDNWASAANGGVDTGQAPPSPAVGYLGSDASDSVVVSKQLLLRYYQLENFAAEYLEWFLQQPQPCWQQDSVCSSLSDIDL